MSPDWSNGANSRLWRPDPVARREYVVAGSVYRVLAEMEADRLEIQAATARGFTYEQWYMAKQRAVNWM